MNLKPKPAWFGSPTRTPQTYSVELTTKSIRKKVGRDWGTDRWSRSVRAPMKSRARVAEVLWGEKVIWGRR